MKSKGKNQTLLINQINKKKMLFSGSEPRTFTFQIHFKQIYVFSLLQIRFYKIKLNKRKPQNKKNY